MSTAPMTSAQFRSIVEPILNKAFDGIYDQRADEWKGVFRQFEGTKRYSHEEPVLYGMPAAPEIPDGTPVQYSGGGVLYIARYRYRVYGQAFAITQVLQEDGDHIRIGSLFSRHLAQSLIETEETNAANILNRSFNSSYTGGDLVSLVNSAHPVVRGTQSNVLATAANLSQTSLEQMLIQIRKAKDSAGRRIRLIPQKLIVSPDNMFQAETILNSVLRPGTANNDINPIRSIGLLPKGVTTITRLTSSTAWWVQNEVTEGLKKANRRNMQRAMEGYFETGSMRYKATMRYVFGWTDWRDLYGTAGV